MRALEHRIPPPLVGLLVGAGMWALAGVGPRLHLPTGLRWSAVALFIAAGLAFDVLGIAAFRASRTTVNPLKPERASALVTGGVYRVTRNPMYVGMACLLLAWAVHLSAVLPFAGVVVFVLFINRFQIRPEERVLETVFGRDYVTYATRVRRWL
jgi:protein-S-isoprenylcysteine O-methyltransferase Ste14